MYQVEPYAEGYDPTDTNGIADQEDPYRKNGTYFNERVSRKSFDLIDCDLESRQSTSRMTI